MQKVQVNITNDVGLHARPAALFVSTANRFNCEVMVRKIDGDEDWADAKSILSILALGAEQGSTIEISTEGDDELEAIETLSHLVQANFVTGS